MHLYNLRNGELLENYTGSKTVDSLKEYVRTMKHKQTEGKTVKKKKTETPSKGPVKKKSSKSKSEL